MISCRAKDCRHTRPVTALVIILMCGLCILLPGPVTAGKALEKQPVTVAAILSTTGIAAPHNRPLLPLIQLAVDEINRTGGLLGHPVKLLLLDNQSSPIGSVQAAKEAIHSRARAVIGAHWSSHSLAMAPLLQQAKIPMITISTNPDITKTGDYIFSATINDRFQGEMVAKFARQDLQARTAVILKNLNEAYSMTLGGYFRETFLKTGGILLFETGYKGNAVDFKKIIAWIKNSGPDVVFIPGYSRDSGLLIKQAVAHGVKTIFLGADAWDDISRYSGDAVDGSFCTAVWHPRMAFPGCRRLVEVFQRRYPGESIPYSAVPWYDAFKLLQDAANRANDIAPEKIREVLARTRNFQGAGGPITFNRNGEPMGKAMVILKYHKQLPRFFKRLDPQLYKESKEMIYMTFSHGE